MTHPAPDKPKLRLYASYATTDCLWRYDLSAHTIERLDRADPVWKRLPLNLDSALRFESTVGAGHSAVPVSRDEARAMEAAWKLGIAELSEGLGSEPDTGDGRCRTAQFSSKWRRATPTAKERLAELAKWYESPEAKALVARQEKVHAGNSERWKKYKTAEYLAAKKARRGKAPLVGERAA